MNVILTGMPGSGKSTLGVLLAKALGYGFIDADLVIQSNEHRLLQDIIDDDGIESFLKCEDRALRSIDCDNTVIATGGSAVLSPSAMDHLKRLGVTVYICVPCAELERRVSNITTRGIAAAKGETLSDIFEERAPLYEKYADVTVNTGGKSLEASVEELVQLLSDRLHVRRRQ